MRIGSSRIRGWVPLAGGIALGAALSATLAVAVAGGGPTSTPAPDDAFGAANAGAVHPTVAQPAPGAPPPAPSARADSVPRAPSPPVTYADSILAWREARVKRLTSDTGWLTVAGLFWLRDGENPFGTDSSNAIVLPPGSAPARAGSFVLERGPEGERVRVRAPAATGARLAGTGAEGAPDSLVTERLLRADDAGAPDVVALGPRLRLFAIRRGERLAIRMRDLESRIRTGFRGIDAYPIDPAYRVLARLEPFDPPRKVPVPNIAGYADSMEAPGRLAFTLGGRRCALTALREDPADTLLFIVFSDETTEIETYGGGRFLYSDPPRGGRVLIDFNKAYNPPCAFTPFTTCPLPPEGNDLPIAVRAGEKKYEGHEE